jgi:hypothetical protein
MSERKWIGPKDIGRILEVVHGLGIHWEAARIPLDAEGSGTVKIEDGKLVIIAPARGELEPFFAGLKDRIRALPGVASLKRAEG